ncbi:MAG: homoserine O-acetyltransferase [Bacteroidales bacterium]|nr:homoserine O-acetyltransferase [Bacteroidales bacterium]
MKSQIYQVTDKFDLELGGSLPLLNIAYHTYGTLNENADNVIWVCHAFTANSEAAVWWPGMIGEGKLMDPDKFFIVSANIIGSCYGSTGPMSTNPETGLPWYRTFPDITIRDVINAHELLRQYLGINRIHTIMGGSIGGFQALEYSIMKPDLIENLIFIASSVKISPWAVAFNQSQRLAIEADPTFIDERPYGGINGLKAARSIALLSYRNEQTYNKTQMESDEAKTKALKASSYQNYQGDKLVKRFDAYSYHAISKLMDTHNVVRDRGSLGEAIGHISANVLSLGISTDYLFPVHEQKLLAHISHGEYREIESFYGHDGFLIEVDKITWIIQDFWRENHDTVTAKTEIESPLELIPTGTFLKLSKFRS